MGGWGWGWAVECQWVMARRKAGRSAIFPEFWSVLGRIWTVLKVCSTLPCRAPPRPSPDLPATRCPGCDPSGGCGVLDVFAGLKFNSLNIPLSSIETYYRLSGGRRAAYHTVCYKHTWWTRIKTEKGIYVQMNTSPGSLAYSLSSGRSFIPI